MNELIIKNQIMQQQIQSLRQKVGSYKRMAADSKKTALSLQIKLDEVARLNEIELERLYECILCQLHNII